VNHDLIADHRATFHLPHMSSTLLILVRRDHEHLIAAWPLTQRADRDGNGFTRETNGNSNPNLRAGGQHMAHIINPRPYHGVPCRRIHACIERDDVGSDGGSFAGRKHVDRLTVP
jgi:hypothetical protein